MVRKKINTYAKMRRTNSQIRTFLSEKGVENVFFTPHTRFIKDFSIDGVKFDGLATYKGKVVFFQAKTNKKPPKVELVQYKVIEAKYGILCWLLIKYDKKGVKLI